MEAQEAIIVLIADINIKGSQFFWLRHVSYYIKGKFCVSVCVYVRNRTYLNAVEMGSKLLGGTQEDPAMVFQQSKI
jgi:hypothetical protein